MGNVMISAFADLFNLLKSITIPFFNISAFAMFIGIMVVSFSVNLIRFILGVSNDNDNK